jgi:hypothetical protein
MDADWTVEQYRFANGHKPFDDFMRTLSDAALAETFALRRRFRRADLLKPPQSKALGGRVVRASWAGMRRPTLLRIQARTPSGNSRRLFEKTPRLSSRRPAADAEVQGRSGVER